ncbi:IclR family transcriptional regulator [Ferviditalea candida]|uniref:IclR family transcriptional regulator n=1 Tax=Ferviditalea candida TaxID=3108399 RepID=A0ABU5ZC15_9BACL|nr:IclR family transcriptional regulator [Paenibacillaceae bacterium T2]
MRNINVKSIQSVDRAIHILNCFSFDRSQLTIDEVTQKTGLSKATAYRLLWTLEKNGLIHYDVKENVYRLGYKMLEYGGIVLENQDIRREVEPFLLELHEKIQHTVLLAVRQEDTMQYLLRYDTDEGFQPRSYVGRRRILHYGALGTIFMAYLPEEEARAIVRQYPLEAHTPNSITDEEQYFKRLKTIREQGYFIDVDETFVGFTAVSVPVMNAGGRVEAVIGIAGPSFKFVGETLQQILELTQKTAASISLRLGYVEGRF